MAKEATTDGFADGVSGSGNKWKDRVEQAADDGRYGPGDDGESNYSDRAGTSEADDKWRQNVAESFGLSPDQVEARTPGSGIDDDTADKWADAVSGASDRWADGVQDVSAQEWESETEDAAEEWLDETIAGLQG